MSEKRINNERTDEKCSDSDLSIIYATSRKEVKNSIARSKNQIDDRPNKKSRENDEKNSTRVSNKSFEKITDDELTSHNKLKHLNTISHKTKMSKKYQFTDGEESSNSISRTSMNENESSVSGKIIKKSSEKCSPKKMHISSQNPSKNKILAKNKFRWNKLSSTTSEKVNYGKKDSKVSKKIENSIFLKKLRKKNCKVIDMKSSEYAIDYFSRDNSNSDLSSLNCRTKKSLRGSEVSSIESANRMILDLNTYVIKESKIRKMEKFYQNNIQKGVTCVSLTNDFFSVCGNICEIILNPNTKFGPAKNQQGFVSILIVECENYKLFFDSGVLQRIPTACVSGMQICLCPTDVYCIHNSSSKIYSRLILIAALPINNEEFNPENHIQAS